MKKQNKKQNKPIQREYQISRVDLIKDDDVRPITESQTEKVITDDLKTVVDNFVNNKTFAVDIKITRKFVEELDGFDS